MSTSNLLTNLLKGGTASGFVGGAAGAALLGLLQGTKVKHVASSVLATGGLAALGTVAWSAYQRYAAVAASTAPVGAPTADDFAVADARALLLIRAMIAAARADGSIDEAERGRIARRVVTLGLGDLHAAAVARELERHCSVDDIANAVDSLGAACDVYVASATAVVGDDPKARWYLSRLATRLNLPPALVAELESSAWSAAA